MPNRAEIEIDNRNKGRLVQAAWSRLWHSCAKFCCPEKADTMRNLASNINPGYQTEPQRHNDVAVDGLRIFSGGVKTWVCPGPSTGWVTWIPHPALQDKTAVKDWLADCMERADGHMNSGGFYSASHSVFEDLGLTSTAALFIDSTGDLPLSCVALSPTEFTFTLTFDKKIASVQVTYHKSASAIYEMFDDNAPDIVRMQVEQNKGDTMHEIIHAVYTRSEDDLEGKKDGEEGGADYAGDPRKMPYGSCWIHVGRKLVMREGGYEEMPFVIPRWRVPTGTDGLYGVSPAMDALASARGVNLMDMLAATQVEVALNPRIKAPPGTGAIDLSPGGVTQVSGTGEGPTEWLSDGSRGGLSGAENFISRKEAQILRAFHADLFDKLAPIAQQREMTNGLVDALERESLSRISPAMGRISQEYIDPAMQRIFMVLYRAGVFAPPPEEAFYQDTSGRRYLVFPRVAQTSRMAQAMNSRKVFAFRAAMERVMPMAQIKPEVLDIYNFETIYRDLDRGDGMPKEWHFEEEDVEAMRQARAMQQQQQQEQAMAMEMATKQPELAMQAAEAAAGQGV